MYAAVISSLGRFARGTLNAYLHILSKRPVPTKIVTGLVTGAIGDTIAQKAEQRGGGNEKVSKVRVVAYSASTGLITAPIYHVAYELLERSAFKTPFKVFIDIVFVTPIWYVLFMPAVTLICRSDDLTRLRDSDCVARNVAAVRSALVDNAARIATLTLTILAPAETINFAFVPLQLRVPYLCLVDLAFVVGVSLVSNRVTNAHPEITPL